jgi:hypothetical protein
MSNFCANCGAATGGGKFCPKCGAVQSAAAANAQQAYAPQGSYVPAPPKRGSSGLKIVVIILAVFVFVGIAGSVGAYYFIKHKVQEVAQSSGAKDWRDAMSSAANAKPTQAGCELISKEKVADILGVTVARAEGNEAGDPKEFCNYYSQAASAADVSKRTDDDDTDGKAKDSQVSMKDLQNLAKKISASSGYGSLVKVKVFRGTAKIALVGIKTAAAITGKKTETIEGPWDEAYFGPMDALLAVRKGDNGVLIDMSRAPQPRDKALELAKVAAEGI